MRFARPQISFWRSEDLRKGKKTGAKNGRMVEGRGGGNEVQPPPLPLPSIFPRFVFPSSNRQNEIPGSGLPEKYEGGGGGGHRIVIALVLTFEDNRFSCPHNCHCLEQISVGLRKSFMWNRNANFTGQSLPFDPT